MPSKTKQEKQDEKAVAEATSIDNTDAPFRTGPNVDIGLEPGAVTVDPETAHGQAARAARDAYGATTTVTEDGVEVVDQPQTPYGPKVDGPLDARRVLEFEEGIAEKQAAQ